MSGDSKQKKVLREMLVKMINQDRFVRSKLNKKNEESNKNDLNFNQWILGGEEKKVSSDELELTENMLILLKHSYVSLRISQINYLASNSLKNKNMLKEQIKTAKGEY